MGDDMACPKDGTEYVEIDGQKVCPKCGHAPGYKQIDIVKLLKENEDLRMRVIELERFVSDYAESVNTKTDFQSWAEKLMKRE